MEFDVRYAVGKFVGGGSYFWKGVRKKGGLDEPPLVTSLNRSLLITHCHTMNAFIASFSTVLFYYFSIYNIIILLSTLHALIKMPVAISPGRVLRNFNNYNKNGLCLWNIVYSCGTACEISVIYVFSITIQFTNFSLENCPSNFSNVPLNFDEWDRMSPLYPDLDRSLNYLSLISVTHSR